MTGLDPSRHRPLVTQKNLHPEERAAVRQALWMVGAGLLVLALGVLAIGVIGPGPSHLFAFIGQ